MFNGFFTPTFENRLLITYRKRAKLKEEWVSQSLDPKAGKYWLLLFKLINNLTDQRIN